MDHESLRTASTYLNNLLLARGLLKNGEAIDFVKPSRESRASIINLVHDLILREDREKESREHVATTIKQLRNENTKKTQDIEALQAKNEQAARNAAQAQQAERVALAEVKKVEKAMKALQDQLSKAKVTLAQVKTQCANDVKKRDLELQRLKTHLQGQQRGTRVGMTAPSMTVRKTMQEPQNVHDPEYSLKQETTEFLTQLSQNLSDENDGLISLVRNALSTMHDLLGTQSDSQRKVDSAIGSLGSDQAARSKSRDAGTNLLQQEPETSYEALAVDLENTLEHLKSILTNPNFVSLEEFEKEVETRDEEIASLRECWEHMEQRWQEVLFMMQGWVKRMNTGDTINIDDLRKGMGLVTPNRRDGKKRKMEQVPEVPEPESSLMDSEPSEIQLPSSEAAATAPTTATPQQEPSLRASDGMRSLTSKLDQLDSPKRKRNVLDPPDMFDFRPADKGTMTQSTAGRSPQSKSSRALNGGLADVFSPIAKSSSRHVAREPTPEPVEMDDGEESEELEVPQMTIMEKLAAAQEEADEAKAHRDSGRAAANGTSRTSKSRRQNIEPDFGLDGAQDVLPGDDTLRRMEGGDTLGNMDLPGSPMAKKTRIRGRPKKRKSTLTRDEMASLLVMEDDGTF